MPMGHLKECPLDVGCPWRPARLQLAQCSTEHFTDNRRCRNYCQHQDPVEPGCVDKPMPLEKTLRAAVSQGHWLSRKDYAKTGAMKGGFEEFQTLRKTGQLRQTSVHAPAPGRPHAEAVTATLQRRSQSSPMMPLVDSTFSASQLFGHRPVATSLSAEKAAGAQWDHTTPAAELDMMTHQTLQLNRDRQMMPREGRSRSQGGSSNNSSRPATGRSQFGGDSFNNNFNRSGSGSGGFKPHTAIIWTPTFRVGGSTISG